MENVLINKLDQHTTVLPYKYAKLIEPFNQFMFFDENLQKILAKSMLLEDKKHRINIALNMAPKKTLSNNKISFKIIESPIINSDVNVNISLNDESSLKFYIEEGISV